MSEGYVILIDLRVPQNIVIDSIFFNLNFKKCKNATQKYISNASSWVLNLYKKTLRTEQQIHYFLVSY